MPLTRLGVLGWPVRHSRSPAMHTAAFAALAMDDWRYQRLPVPPELFAETVPALRGAGFAGANVTLPHKHAALELATQASPAARAIGAANTLSLGVDGTIAAENTDAPGFLDALGFDPAGARSLVLGAGGSARAVVWALRRAGAEVAVWNRTSDRAERLAADLGARVVSQAGPAELLVNCTTVGLEVPTLKGLPLDADDLDRYAYVADLVYGAEPTPLISAARARGVVTIDGLEILVRQGARSFEIWTGRAAPLEAMRRGAAGAQD